MNKDNSKRHVEIYEVPEGIFTVVVTSEEETAADATSRWIRATGSLRASLEQSSHNPNRILITGNAELAAFLAANEERLKSIFRFDAPVEPHPDGSPQLLNTIAICAYSLNLIRLAKAEVAQSNFKEAL